MRSLKTLNPLDGPLAVYVRAQIETRVAGLRTKDRGASAIELAVIAAVLVVIALAILGVIHQFVTSRSQQIQNLQGTNP